MRKGDRYVLNGEKIYITNAGLAQVFTVMAITDRSKGIKGISAFIVERNFPGFSVGRNEVKMGMHGCTTAPLAFSDCEVPAENLLGEEGMGYVRALKTLTSGARDGRGPFLRHHGQAHPAMRGFHENTHAGRTQARRTPGAAMDARRHVGRV